MKNNHFKNALISGACAIISGVLLLGANAVFGEAPTHEPPGTGIAPTFTGLTVNGQVTAGGVNFPLVAKIITEAAPSAIGIINSAGNYKFAINLENNLVRFYDDYLGNGWNPSIVLKEGNVGIGTTGPQAKLHSTGNVYFAPDGTWGVPGSAIAFEDQGTFRRIVFNELRFWDWGGGEDMVIFNNGNVGIGTSPTSALSVKGAIDNPTTTTSGSKVTSYPVRINDSLYVAGDSRFIGNSSFNDNLFVNGTVTISDGSSTIDVGVNNGDLIIYDDLVTTGRIRADFIGKYNLRESGSWTSISPGQYGFASVYCPTGEAILSCQARGGSLSIAYNYIDGAYCYVYAKNNYTSSQSLKAQAMCFDSEGI